MITAEPPKVVAGALYNATQACKILGGISRATLWKYVKSGFIHPKATTNKPTTAASATATTANTNTSPEFSTSDPSDMPVDNTKKIMKGYKVNGYRVQAFAGGNTRKDRIQAEQTGDRIKASFPDAPVYVHFYSPRWICRVGNYRTYEEAHQMLVSLRKQGFTQATIVKGKITVQY